MKLAKLTNDEARLQIFNQLVNKLREDVKTGKVNNSTPHVFSLSRHGSLLTVSQDQGSRLLRGHVQWPHRTDGDQDHPWEFSISRAVDLSRLQLVTKGGPTEEGTPDEIIHNIVNTFIEKT